MSIIQIIFSYVGKVFETEVDFIQFTLKGVVILMRYKKNS